MTALEMIRVIGTEFSAVDDETMRKYIEIVEPMVSEAKFGKLYNQAIAYLVCHKMKMAGYGESALGGFGISGNALTIGYSVGSVSDGGSSISFSNGSAGNTSTDAEYAMTVYGTQYLQLRKMCIIPITISGGGEVDAWV